MLIHSFIDNAAQVQPDRIAVIHDPQRLSYFQLFSMVNRLGAFMQENGIARGDRIALLLENSIEYVAAYYASLKVGAVAAPLNPSLKPDGLQYLVDDLEPTCIVTSFKCERLLKAVALPEKHLKLLIISKPKQQWRKYPFTTVSFEEAFSNSGQTVKDSGIGDTDLASIIYTSGSTGKPKGVMLSHKNIVSNTQSICKYLSLSPKDIQMVVLPFFYVMGKSLLNSHMASGGTIVINNRFMYPADVLKQMIEEKVTSFSGVPSTYAYLLHRSPLAGARDRLNHLRYCSQAGGHMSKALKLELRNVLPEHTRIVIMYGATEASARLTYLSPEYFESKIESIGKPIPNVSVRVVNEDGREVPRGEEGELVASGDNIMLGYWKDPSSTAVALRNRSYHTGDIGFCDDDGFLYILRRKDGLLKVAGHRVNPTEIEDFLMESGLIVETAIIGIPDKLLGNRLCAIVVFKDKDCDPRDLLKKCASGLPRHKIPSEIIPIRTLPKNASGKIDGEACLKIVANEHRTTKSKNTINDEVSQ